MNLDRINISKKWSVINQSPRFSLTNMTNMKSSPTTIYEDVKVYDYAFKAFHKLRFLDGISSYTIY